MNTHNKSRKDKIDQRTGGGGASGSAHVEFATEMVATVISAGCKSNSLIDKMRLSLLGDLITKVDYLKFVDENNKMFTVVIPKDKK